MNIQKSPCNILHSTRRLQSNNYQLPSLPVTGSTTWLPLPTARIPACNNETTEVTKYTNSRSISKNLRNKRAITVNNMWYGTQGPCPLGRHMSCQPTTYITPSVFQGCHCHPTEAQGCPPLGTKFQQLTQVHLCLRMPLDLQTGLGAPFPLGARQHTNGASHAPIHPGTLQRPGSWKTLWTP